MAINTAGIIAKLKEAIAAAPTLSVWAKGLSLHHQNVSAAMRGDIIPQDSIAKALGYRRVQVQAYLAPGEALPLLPPGWEEVIPGSATPVGWTPRDKIAEPAPRFVPPPEQLERARAARKPRPIVEAKTPAKPAKTKARKTG